jgi:hypothetical protein
MKALARQGFQPGFVRSSFRLAIDLLSVITMQLNVQQLLGIDSEQ